MKKITAISTAFLLFMAAAAASAHAGAARRHTIEGFMLGTGAAIIGAAIINSLNKEPAPAKALTHRSPPPHKTYHYSNCRGPGRFEKSYRRHHQPKGHWEIRRIWIDPVYERRWNPGHYKPNGRWTAGGYDRFMVRQGYWKKEKIWVWH